MNVNSQVVHMVERVAVTLGFFALFMSVLLTHNMSGAIEGIMAGGLGVVLTAWFGGNISSATASQVASGVSQVVAQQASSGQHPSGGQQG